MTLNIFLVSILIAIIYTDFRILRIPNVLLLIAFIIQSVIIWINYLNIQEHILGMIVGLSSGLIIMFAGKAWYKKSVFGMGDVKLMALMGLVCGWYYFFPVFFLGTFMATVFSLIGMALKKYSKESKIPLGAFLSFALVCYIFAEKYWTVI